MIQLLCDDCDDFPRTSLQYIQSEAKKMFFSNRVIFTSKLSRKSLHPTYFLYFILLSRLQTCLEFSIFFFGVRLTTTKGVFYSVAMCILNDNDTYYKHTCHTVLGVLILWIFNIKNRLFVCRNLKCSKDKLFNVLCICFYWLSKSSTDLYPTEIIMSIAWRRFSNLDTNYYCLNIGYKSELCVWLPQSV